MSRMAHCGALAMGLLLPACVHVDWDVRHVEDPIPDGALAQLEPGKDDLGRCLQVLGAPHFVWEYRGEGAALAWVSLDSSTFSFDISYTFEHWAPTSFSYENGAANLPGVVLWFGPDLVLERWRRGRMRDLTSGLHHRPAEPDDGG
jgi:hypothetical protein